MSRHNPVAQTMDDFIAWALAVAVRSAVVGTVLLFGGLALGSVGMFVFGAEVQCERFYGTPGTSSARVEYETHRLHGFKAFNDTTDECADDGGLKSDSSGDDAVMWVVLGAVVAGGFFLTRQSATKPEDEDVSA